MDSGKQGHWMRLGSEEIRQRILKVLYRVGGPAGARQVGVLLHAGGVDLSERGIRGYLTQLDAGGFTRLVSRRRGRELTEQGKAALDLEPATAAVGPVSGRMDDWACRMSFQLRAGMGTLPVNRALLAASKEARALELIRPVLAARMGMGSRLLVLRAGAEDPARPGMKIPRGRIALVTVCNLALNGILLRSGIPMEARFGGLLEYRSRLPQRFVEQIRYDGTTRAPLELLTLSGLTAVRSCVQEGKGRILAGFREVPAASLPALLKICDHLRLLGLSGLLTAGVPEEPIYGVPVGPDRVGVVLLGGLNPFAALQEAGMDVELCSMAGLLEYRKFPEYRFLNMLTPR